MTISAEKAVVRLETEKAPMECSFRDASKQFNKSPGARFKKPGAGSLNFSPVEARANIGRIRRGR